MGHKPPQRIEFSELNSEVRLAFFVAQLLQSLQTAWDRGKSLGCKQIVHAALRR